MPTIVVLVKHVPDTWSTKTLSDDFTLNRDDVDEVIDEINEAAVEQALRIKETHPDAGFRVVALTMGTQRSEEAVRKAIAMGADQAIVLTDEALAGSDALGTAWALHNALAAIDDVVLIVAGNASSDGQMGTIPALLSEYRQIPALTNVGDVTIDLAQQSASAVRTDHHGSYELSASIPAIISVNERAAKPRFPNFQGIMAAKKAEVTVVDCAAIGVDAAHVGGSHAATVVRSATQRPERVQGTIVSDAGDGSSAVALADFLQTRGLI